jgi:nucleotide-binding universal stress UspA family protein
MVNATIRSILVGVDGSDEADRGVAMAAKLAQCFSARLILAGVIEPASAEQQAEGYGPEGTAHREERLRQTLETAAAPVSQSGVNVEVRLLSGDAGKILAELAKNEGCDLIVIGHRDISRVRRFLEGSTSSGLLRDTDISLLIVR